MKTTQKISNKTEIKPSTTIRISKVESARNKLIRDVTIKQYLFTVKAGLLLLGLFAGPVQAQNFYVCNDGSDSNRGSSPYQPWATFDFAMSRFKYLNAGDAILFCRGGTFTSSYPRLFNQHCTADAPCTIADYIPPNAAASTKSTNAKLPLITSSTSNGVLNFQDGGNADHDEGYVVKNLSLKGKGTGFGIFLFNDVDFVTVDGLTIDGFDIGMYSAGANAPNPGANRVNENIELRNSQIINNNGQGWLGGCNDCVIDNNKFTNNGFARKIFNHNIYIGASNNFGITVSNNTLTKSTFVAGKCAGVSLVVHGVVNGLTIKDNTVFEDIGAAEQTCWGISVDPGYATEESFSNVLITGNKVTNVGNVGIGCASCTDLQILDNTITHSQDFGFTGIRTPVRTEDTVKSDRILITGNYIELLDPNHRGKQGIVVTATGDVNVGSNDFILR
ncbi:right-handed parallel beta-helix repeat-containing protein [Methylobacter luteus]|uniref:right-handed parallel beta-helix repeat-containing protein n=1 Tax=Methylobacter luteus TaxID=415 RepID=UPI0003FB83B7|nr:right-handed parallel beta-helix repeat-containing protein [Methylobacter luteus]